MSAAGLFLDVSPLRASRAFRVLWLSQLATTAGRQFVLVAVPYQVYVLTHSSLAVGLLGVFQAVPIVVAGLYGGALADRMDRRRLQLIGKVFVALGSLALAAGAVGLRAPVGFVYAVVVITSAATTLDQAARTATVPRLVPRELLPSAMSLSQVLFQAASIAGPALAGLLIATAGVSWAYAFDAAAFVPAAALVWMLPPQPPAEPDAVARGWRAPAQAIGYVRRNRLVTALFSADLVAMIFGMPTALFPALALSVLGIGAGGLGLLYAAPAIGALLGSLVSGWIRRVNRQGMAVVLAIAVWGAAIAGFGLAGRALWLGLPLLALAGAGDLVSAIFRGTILQLTVPDGMRGRMSAFHMMVVTTGPRLGDLEAGAVAALVSPLFSVVSGGIACIVGIAVLAAALPELRHYRAMRDEVTPAAASAAD
ncbi:MAG TPA: MFS transporter [Candidatus Dormibacteraeota bacterium]|nr:MFS transporter [Candidatus Dormibacteraeota bacterium]